MDICKFKVVSKRCVFSVCALLILCVCVFLCACDGEDVKDFFQPTDFSITFVLDNGQDSVVWHTGDEVPTPMLDGYKFLYWCVDKERNNRANLDFDNVNLVNSITLYAKWQKLSDFSDLVFESYTVTYDGNAHSLEVENLPDGASVTYSAATQYVDAGVYEVCATVSKEDFNDATLKATLTIEKAQVGDIVMNDKTLTWDGNEHSIYVENDLPQGVSVSYENNAQTEPGVYEVVAHFDVGNNFEPVADKTAKLTINEKTYTILFEDCLGKTTRIVGHGKTLLDVPEPSEKDGYVAVWDRTSFENVTCELQVTAIYTPVEYRVIYNTNGGVVPDEDTIFTIERGAVLHTPQRDYYAFEGWYSDPALQNAVAEIGTGNVGNKNVYAKWRAITYYVTFDLDGGNNNANNVNCDDKYAFTVESETFAFAEPKKTYYDFCGWYLDAEFSEPIAKISKGTHGSFAVYAKWTPQVYSISYDYAGGEKTDNPFTYTHFDNDLILLAPVRAHYDFAGWFNIAGEKIERIASGSCGNIELFARWTATEYSISYNLNGGVQSVSNPTIYTVEDKNITLCVPTKTHYSFEGWFLDEAFCNAVSQIETADGKDLQLYAKWSAVQYTVSFENASVAGIVYTVESESFDLPVATKLGYTFVGWFANADLSGENVSRIEQGSYGNVTLYAKFTLNRYTITYDTQGGVNAVENKTEYTIEDGNITLYAPVRNYYDFAGWYENGMLVESISATRLCNINLVAKWTAVEYTISYDLNGGTCEDTLVSKYTVESEDIILPTLSKDGCIFAGWYDGDVKVEKIASGSHGDIALLAKWASATYSVTYVCDGEHSNPAQLNVGDEYTLKDAQKTGYSFEGWYGDQSYSDRVYVLASSGESVTVYAKFAPVVYTITYDYDGGTGVENPTTYTVESEDIMLCDATKDGFEFAGWFDQDVKVERIAKGSHGNLSLVAKWIENSPFVVEGSEIVGYTGSDTHIVVPSKVGDVQITSIGADVFQSVVSCVEIIEIEEGITTIAQGVFFNLTKLRIVSLPSTITQMPQKAFKDCVLLEEMTLPFVGATKYKNDEFVGTGKYAYSFSYVFDGFADTSLGSKVDVSAIRFAKDGTNEELTFSEVAYVPTSLKKVTILDGDLIVYAFKNCANIEQIVVKGGGTVVDKQAFAKCTNLASVELAGGFESFGTACFSARGLQTITVQNETQKSTLEKYLNDNGITTITVSVASTLA